jgi:hypothetical protein
LRSLADSAGETQTLGDTGSGDSGNRLTIVRYGDAQAAAR